MTWSSQLRDLVSRPVSGLIAPTAYDTAWVARIPDPGAPNTPAFPSALDWLLEHQWPDGSWGSAVEYHHDRLQGTLCAALTLIYWQKRQGHTDWSSRIRSAVQAIWRHASCLARDPYEILGFELTFPALLEEARELDFPIAFNLFGEIFRIKEEKLSRIPAELIYSSRTTLVYSAEFLGKQLDVGRMKEALDAQGSLGSSPSATAYYLLRAPEDRRAYDYLARVVARGGGGAGAVDPIDGFEPAWVLFNALLVWPDARELAPHIEPALGILKKELATKQGVAHSTYFPVSDLDDTAMAVRVLQWAKESWSLDTLRQFEEKEHFRCYMYERNPSISAHVHLLEALVAAPPSGERDRMVKKTIAILERLRSKKTFWFDKWHASPYYTTAHAVLALRHHLDVAQNAIDWMVHTQRPDGSWGYYGQSTAEETAYCVQALLMVRRSGRRIEPDVIERGVAFLEGSTERREESYIPLWIAKNLYTPTYVVHSTVLGALALAEQG